MAVSEDIDPTNTDAVFWSLAYRSNPVEDVHIAPHRSAGHGPKSGPRSEESTMLIDATLKHTAPPLALPTREYMEHARGIWQELGLPALAPQPPWHGYSLGDWSDRWDVYARARGRGQVGGERSGDFRAPPRRPHSGDASARCGGEEGQGLNARSRYLRPHPEEHPCKSIDLHGCVSKGGGGPGHLSGSPCRGPTVSRFAARVTPSDEDGWRDAEPFPQRTGLPGVDLALSVQKSR